MIAGDGASTVAGVNVPFSCPESVHFAFAAVPRRSPRRAAATVPWTPRGTLSCRSAARDDLRAGARATATPARGGGSAAISSESGPEALLVGRGGSVGLRGRRRRRRARRRRPGSACSSACRCACRRSPSASPTSGSRTLTPGVWKVVVSLATSSSVTSSSLASTATLPFSVCRATTVRRDWISAPSFVTRHPEGGLRPSVPCALHRAAGTRRSRVEQRRRRRSPGSRSRSVVDVQRHFAVAGPDTEKPSNDPVAASGRRSASSSYGALTCARGQRVREAQTVGSARSSRVRICFSAAAGDASRAGAIRRPPQARARERASRRSLRPRRAGPRTIAVRLRLLGHVAERTPGCRSGGRAHSLSGLAFDRLRLLLFGDT